MSLLEQAFVTLTPKLNPTYHSAYIKANSHLYLSFSSIDVMASRNRPRGVFVKDDASDAHEERNMWSQIVTDIKRLKTIHARAAELARMQVDLEARMGKSEYDRFSFTILRSYSQIGSSLLSFVTSWLLIAISEYCLSLRSGMPKTL